MQAMANDIFDTCGPRIINVSHTCDGSLSKANIQGLTPGTLTSLQATATDEAFLYRQHMLARISGFRENTLMEFMMSNITKVKKGLTKMHIGEHKSFFLPYFLREQEDNINANAFKIEAGQANPDAGKVVNGVTHAAHTWELTVRGSDSEFYTEIQEIQRYFLPKEFMVVLNLSATNAVEEPYFKIISAVNYVDGGEPNVPKAKVIIEPNHSEVFNAALGAPEKLVFQPDQGVVMLGANSVSDYEAWCHNQPTELSKRLIAFWPQTSRFTHCFDDVTKDYLEKIFAGQVNPYLQRFRELPLSKQNRLQFAVHERKLMNSFWYGQVINEFQTVETYQQLPRIEDPRKNGVFIEYQANALGVKTQLNACGRVIDQGGAALDLNVLETQLYALKRYREAEGGNVTMIDAFTDRLTASRLRSIFADLYKARYGVEWRDTEKKKVMFGEQVVFDFQSYSFDEAGIMLNVFVHPFFSDFKTHFKGTLASRGNQLIMVDWNDLKWGILKTNSRTSKTPNLETDPDFQCRISANIEQVEMQSVTWTPIIEDPKRHLIIENFSDECPEFTLVKCIITPG